MVARDALACPAAEIEQVASIYERHGVAVARGGVESELVEQFRRCLERVISGRLRSLGEADGAPSLDTGYLRLKARNPALAGELVMVAREALAYFHVAASRRLNGLVSRVAGSSLLHMVPDSCIARIDGRDDDARSFDWHYDFSYNAMSENAVTCWIPVTPVDDAMGPLRILPGSHRVIRPVRLLRELANVPFTGPKRIQLDAPDVAAFERDSVDLPPVGPGDVVLLHALTLHRSGRNGTDRARWIINPRYSDLLDAKVVARGWNVSRARNSFVFGEIYPEYVVEATR